MLLPLACIIAGLHSPLWIWPQFLLPSLCFFLGSGPPPWLGAFREYLLLFWVCLCTHTDGDSGTPHVKHHAGLIASVDFTGGDFMLHTAGFYLHIPRE